jgi:hypothetical protein
MSAIKFTDLPSANSLNGGEIIAVVQSQSGTLTSVQTPLNALRTYILTGTANQPATTNSLGGVIVDGTTISVTSQGNISVNYAAVPGSIIPSTDVTYDLGSATQRWKSLYLGPATLYIQDASTSTNVPVTVSNGQLTLNGAQVTANTVVHAFAFDNNKNLIYTQTAAQSFNYTSDGVNSLYAMVDVGTNIYSYSLDANGNLIATFSS